MPASVVTVIGARPQFVKAAVVSIALKNAGVTEEIVHTGQHYDEAMSGAFIRELGIDNIVAQFACGNGTHAVQTAKMMTEFEGFLLAKASLPDFVVVYGDTNSTIAAALVASKLHIPIAHVEAGLRSFDRRMPEEVNRVVTDHLSSVLFCSSQEGVEQLRREGIESNVIDVGDVMLDAFQHFSNKAKETDSGSGPESVGNRPYALVTIHRPSNTDVNENLTALIRELRTVSDVDFVWPVHPRLRERIKQFEIPDNVKLVEPVPYLAMLKLLSGCQFVVTDSGGLQKEAYWAKKPCITARRATEWGETLYGGWNQLYDPNKESLLDVINNAPSTPWRTLYGDGQSSIKIAEELKSRTTQRA